MVSLHLSEPNEQFLEDHHWLLKTTKTHLLEVMVSYFRKKPNLLKELVEEVKK